MYLTVKYNSSGYKVKRNIIYSDDIDGTVFKRSYDLLNLPNHLYYLLFGTNQFLANSHYPLFNSKNSVWHLFNSISFGNSAWVTTFETMLPRWGFEYKPLLIKGFKLMAGKACKRLIAMSNCSYNIQKLYMQAVMPELWEPIKHKLTVLYPPQDVIINDYSKKNLKNDKLVFTIVGADFFRKGGKEILFVFDHLLQDNAPVFLNIISSLQYGDYATKSSKQDWELAKGIIDKHQSIVHYENLPNDEVLKILRKTHVGLLPTYADTYGFFVLEAQAAGCPVITTNIRALTEINDNQCGWIIDIPKYNSESNDYREFGRAHYRTKSGRKIIHRTIIEQLYSIICEILNSPNVIENKGIKSINRIRKFHNPQINSKKLYEIYQSAIAN